MKIFCKLLVISLLFSFGCSEKKQTFPLTSIRPTVMEAKSVLVEYHNREVQKYQEALMQEKGRILSLLKEHKMREVRVAYNRQQLYMRKVKEHQLALKNIEGTRDATNS